jgi:hypothetical protein
LDKLLKLSLEMIFILIQTIKTIFSNNQ